MAMVRQVHHERVLADYLWFARFTTNGGASFKTSVVHQFVVNLAKDIYHWVC